jgi:hypothetical protein
MLLASHMFSRYFHTEPAPTRPELLSRPPPRPENPPNHQEAPSSAGPIVLSPPNKSRRVTLLPGVINADVHSGKMEKSLMSMGETPNEQFGMPMSTGTQKEMGMLPRPKLSRCTSIEVG